MKIKFASKVIMFEETLGFLNAIIFYYSRQKFAPLQWKVLEAQMWAITKIVTFALNPIISTCVLNQSKGHWLLLNVLIIAITLIVNMEVKLL
jgi:hypothetical protein